MLNERALKCLKGIIEKINSIDRICKENGGVVKALEKRTSAINYYALYDKNTRTI